jgi:predicted RNase H-like HicB family nuclease
VTSDQSQPRKRFDVAIQYSRTVDVYDARLADFQWGWGYGETEDAAVEELCNSLQQWLERWDGDREGFGVESPIVRRLHGAWREGTLLEQLRAGMREAVLDPSDEPSR